MAKMLNRLPRWTVAFMVLCLGVCALAAISAEPAHAQAVVEKIVVDKAVPIVRAPMEGIAASPSPEAMELSLVLRKRYPATQFDRITPAHVDGLFEVVMGKNIAYTDVTGRYFVFGHLFDMDTRTDLTQAALGGVSAADAKKTLDWSSLPLADAIVFGAGSKKLAVFSDPDCPFCKRVEPELMKLVDTQIYVFPFPIAQLHPNAEGVAKRIWCAKDRAQAWRDYLVNGAAPVPGPLSSLPCANPIQSNIELAERLGINATPTLIAGDGRVVTGSATAKEIGDWLADERSAK